MTSHRTVLTALVGLLVCAPAASAQPQSWDKQLSASRRFIVLEAFGGAAVLDKETGLVWERTPGDLNGDGLLNASDDKNWSNALYHCTSKVVGNRRGWRLPTVQELASLLDPSVQSPGPQLSPGHPFEIGGPGAPAFWTASTYVLNPAGAFLISFVNGLTPAPDKATGAFFVWCVRGGQGVDPQ
jgi:Protein of unknown function (DUF1566)